MDMPKSGGTTTVDSGAYTDLNRLSALKHGDKDSDANLKKVAQEFESLFVSQMLKAMRSANEVLAKDNPMNTAATRQYQDMYDQQLAVTMSTKGGGIGLQQVLMRQLSKNKDGQVAPPTSDAGSTPLATRIAQKPLWAARVATADQANTGVPRNDVAALNSRRLALPSKLTDRLLMGIVPSSAVAQSDAAKNRITVPGAAFAHRGNGDWTQDRTSGCPLSRRRATPAAWRSLRWRRQKVHSPAPTILSRPCCHWPRTPPRESASIRRCWWHRPRWKPGGANPSCVSKMAAAATTCSVSRLRATGRGLRRGRSPASFVTARWSRRRLTSALTTLTPTASMTW